MKSILFVSELGAGLGHIAPLMSIADAISSASSKKPPKITFAVPDSISTRLAFGDSPYPILASPVKYDLASPLSHTSSFIEILTRAGFANADLLSAAVASWQNLVDIVKPDLIIADHSPTACLMARGKLPVILIGSGYTMPPTNTQEFPALAVGMQPPAIHKTVLTNVNSILKAGKQNELESLPKLLETELRFVFTAPHLDPYNGLRKEPVIGTYNDGISHSPVPTDNRIFLYAGAVRNGLEAIAKSVLKMKVPVSAYLGSQTNVAKEYLKAAGAEVFDSPPPLSKILTKSTVVVSHGGAGLANASMLVGRPQLIIPIHAESRITAGKIEALGIGLAVEKIESDPIEAALDPVLNVRSFETNAQKIALDLSKTSIAQTRIDDIAKQILSKF